MKNYKNYQQYKKDFKEYRVDTDGSTKFKFNGEYYRKKGDDFYSREFDCVNHYVWVKITDYELTDILKDYLYWREV